MLSEINDLHQIRVMFPSTSFRFKQKLQLLPLGFICHPVFAALSTVVFFFHCYCKVEEAKPENLLTVYRLHSCLLTHFYYLQKWGVQVFPWKNETRETRSDLYLSPGRETSLSGVYSWNKVTFVCLEMITFSFTDQNHHLWASCTAALPSFSLQDTVKLAGSGG